MMFFFSLIYISNFFNELHLSHSGQRGNKSGRRLLRAMIDEFYMFDCPLKRPEILELMHHCKVYWSKSKNFYFKTYLLQGASVNFQALIVKKETAIG